MGLKEWARIRRAGGAIWCAVLVGLAGGCAPSAPPPSDAKTIPAAALTADEVLERMRAAYAAAEAYSDNGVLEVKFRQNGNDVDESAPLAVSLVRPCKLRVKAYLADVACDGTTFRGQILDEPSQNLDGQFVERPAPERLVLADLLADRVLYEQGLGSGDAKHPMSLQLLLAEKPLAEFSGPANRRTLLEPKPLNGKECYRVEVTTAGGPFVFWVDKEAYLLRRVEYPTAALAEQLRGGGEVSHVSMAVDFRDARFAAVGGANAFTLDPPANAKRVRYLVLPPPPLPSQRLGQKIDDFHFQAAAGADVTRASLAGKIAVLAFFSDDARHQPYLQAIDAVAQKFPNREQVVFAGVCADGGATGERLEQLAADWKLTLPLARDANQAGRSAFGITQVPALVVLDGASTLHFFDVFDPNIAEILPAALERLLKGENLAAEVLKQAKIEREAYEQQLATAAAAKTSTLVPIPAAAIAERTEPRKLKLERRWACTALAAPGNFVVVAGQTADRVFVCDGFRTVVELGGEGEVVARHELALRDRASVTYLRAAAGPQGQIYFAAGSVLAPEAFLFNDSWQLQASYPPADQKHEGVRDVALADLDGDGVPEAYFGFWSLLGVHAVSLEGKSLWTNRVFPTTLALAVSPANEVGFRKLLALGDRGQVLRLNQFGKNDSPVEVPGRALFSLVASRFHTPRATAYCGLAFQTDGRMAAVALDANLKEQWSYPLAPGAYENQIEPIASGHLLGTATGHWVFTGPDGGLAIISDDGQFVDVFNYGERLSGIAVARLGGEPLLLVSSGKKIEAWRVTLPADAPDKK